MMFAPRANDVGFANDVATLMMCASWHISGKHHIITSCARYIIMR